MLVIHLGGNDLARHCGKALILDVLRDLKWLRPTCTARSIIWSTIIPHMVWRDAQKFLPVNAVQRSVNREICRVFCSSLGSVIGHQRTQLDRPEFFWTDGVHISDDGLDVFLEDIKGNLLLEFDNLDGGHGT